MLHLQWPQAAALCWMGIKGFIENPFLYIALIVMVWDVRNTAVRARLFFGFRVARPWRRLVGLWLGSILVGLVVSVLCLGLGLRVQPWQVWTVTALCLVGGLIRTRFAAGLYGISALVVIGVLSDRFLPHTQVGGIMGRWLSTLQSVHAEDWLSLGCLLAFAEALLLWLRRNDRTPALRRSRRGRPVGAFVVQQSFLFPIFVLTPGVVPVAVHTPWPWPLWGLVSAGAGIIGWPVLAGWSGIHSVSDTVPVLRRESLTLCAIGVMLGADAWVCHQFGSLYAIIGAVLALTCREWTRLRSSREELTGDPLYVPSAAGVKVLAVVPGSVADSMGLKSGEVIRQVNQVPVHTTYDLHFALDQNPAYAKLEVLDVRGELRIVGKPVYTGERHQLGLLLVPDRATVGSFDRPALGLLQTLYPKVAAAAVGPEQMWSDTEPRTFTT